MDRKPIILILIFITVMNSCNTQITGNGPYSKERQRMVNEQIKSRGIRNSGVLDAMLQVKRHLFVPAELRDMAYEDHPLPIGEDQTISQPYIVALMTDLLEVDENSKVLEIGTGSGYQAAVLAEICDSVYSIEIFESLGQKAGRLLSELGYDNVSVKIGDGFKGWPEHSPFDGIIVTCAPEDIPDPLADQLAEGGRMIIPVGNVYNQELILVKKSDGELKRKKIIPVRFVPMIDKDGKTY